MQKTIRAIPATILTIVLALIILAMASCEVTVTQRYTVSYDPNGATAGLSPVDSATYAAGAAVTVLGAGTLSRTGFTFIGWNTAADGGGIAHAPASQFTMGAANLNLYAQWRQRLSVAYSPNGASGGAAPDDPATYDPGDTVTVLGQGTLLRVDHDFSGWNTRPDGLGTAYAPSSAFAIGNSNVTLYATWTPLGYQTVLYFANGGLIGSVPVDGGHYNSGDTVTVLPPGTLARDGRTFEAWNTATDGSGTDYAPAATFTMGSVGVALYAKWLDPLVHFDTGGGSAVADARGLMIASFPVSALDGYALEGWYPDASFTPGQKIVFPYSVDKDQTLYARWIPSTAGLAFAPVSDGYSVSAGTINPTYTAPGISVTIPAYWLGLPVTEIPDYGFYPEDSPGSGTNVSYASIISVSLPDTLKRIGRYGISHTRVSAMTIPASVTSLGTYALEYCQFLLTLDIQATITAIPDGLCNCNTQLNSITFPAGTTSIGSTVFNQCQHLQSISLPATLQTIGSQVFWAAGLTSITIPASVTFLGGRVFNQCTALATVTLQRPTPPNGNTTYDTFNGCTSLAHIYVPTGSLVSYTASNYWNWSGAHTALFSE